MQLSLNVLQVHTIYAGRNAEAVHGPLHGEWIYQTNRGGGFILLINKQNECSYQCYTSLFL